MLMAGPAVLPLVLLEQAEEQQELVAAEALAQKEHLRLHQFNDLPAPVLHRSAQHVHQLWHWPKTQTI